MRTATAYCHPAPVSQPTAAARIGSTRLKHHRNHHDGESAAQSRRSFGFDIVGGGGGAALAAAVVASSVSSLVSASAAQPANAALERSSDRFDFGRPLTEELARQRFEEGRKSLQYLLDHYDEICEGGGDNVRRYLGTVGTTSGLWGIGKVLTKLRDSSEDIVEFTELKNEFESAVTSADGSAYMAIFVTTSSSSTPPAKYFEDARKEAKLARRLMDQLAKQIQQ